MELKFLQKAFHVLFQERIRKKKLVFYSLKEVKFVSFWSVFKTITKCLFLDTFRNHFYTKFERSTTVLCFVAFTFISFLFWKSYEFSDSLMFNFIPFILFQIVPKNHSHCLFRTCLFLCVENFWKYSFLVMQKKQLFLLKKKL